MKNEDYHAEENMNIVRDHSPEYLQEEQDNRQQFEEEKDEIISPSDWDEIEKQSLAALNQFGKGLTKVDVKEMATNAVENLLINGNPLQIAEALSAMEMFIKEVKDDPRYKDYVREEVSKYPKGFVSKSEAKIECAEVGSSYDYSKCQDPELADLLEIESINGAKITARKAFLKTIPVSGLDIITGEGEAVKVYPPSKSSTSSYKVTLSKGF